MMIPNRPMWPSVLCFVLGVVAVAFLLGRCST